MKVLQSTNLISTRNVLDKTSNNLTNPFKQCGLTRCTKQVIHAASQKERLETVGSREDERKVSQRYLLPKLQRTKPLLSELLVYIRRQSNEGPQASHMGTSRREYGMKTHPHICQAEYHINSPEGVKETSSSGTKDQGSYIPRELRNAHQRKYLTTGSLRYSPFLKGI